MDTQPRATIREVPPLRPEKAAPPRSRRESAVQARRSTARPTILRQERASFGFAFAGLGHAWATQRHLRIHVALALLAVGLGMFLGITAAEWAALLAIIALVLALELLNTVVEVVVDLVTTDFHPKAKVAKDVSAAAVLVAAMGALAVGAVIFVPRIVTLALTILARSAAA
jgi:diacylglycerol kinase (ATP)